MTQNNLPQQLGSYSAHHVHVTPLSENCQPSGHYLQHLELKPFPSEPHINSNVDLKSVKAPITNLGEIVIPYAPSVTLPNGNLAIPQHYLRFEHHLESIQEIISHISPIPLTPIFADKDEYGCYVQVGIIGEENYDRSNTILPKKIVYGRKWRVEDHTPTSEIIQTAFLAVKKLWEHEIREFFVVKEQNSNKTSALFSCHHDLPLMANNGDLIASSINTHQDTQESAQEDIIQLLKRTTFKHHTFTITEFLVRRQNTIIDLHLEKPLFPMHKVHGETSRFDNFSTSLVLEQLNPSEFLYGLMDALIAYSDQLIEEGFAYKNFTRFSRQHDPLSIAALSIASRPYAEHMQDQTFASTFQKINYETDTCRVPNIGDGALAEKNRRIIDAVEGLTGHLPHGFTKDNVDL